LSEFGKELKCINDYLPSKYFCNFKGAFENLV